MLIAESRTEKEIFAAATQFYVRLRRIDGRVIDVHYMIQNREYAKYVLSYAANIVDAELQRYWQRLNSLCEIPIAPEAQAVEEVKPAQQEKHRDQSTWFLG